VRKELLRPNKAELLEEISSYAEQYNHTPDKRILDERDFPPSMGEGERHAIEIAIGLSRKHPDKRAVVVTDDKRARNFCRKKGVEHTGTLGLIELAKKRKLISKREALKTISRIPSTSLYIAPGVLEEAAVRVKQQE